MYNISCSLPPIADLDINIIMRIRIKYYIIHLYDYLSDTCVIKNGVIFYSFEIQNSNHTEIPNLIYNIRYIKMCVCWVICEYNLRYETRVLESAAEWTFNEMKEIRIGGQKFSRIVNNNWIFECAHLWYGRSQFTGCGK